MNGLTFAQPQWFWAFAGFPLLVALAFESERARIAAVRKVVAVRLQPRLAGTVNVGLRWFRFLLLLLGLAAVIVTLARPQWGFAWEDAKRKGRDVLIAIDTSRSMLADDVKPSRLARAKLAAENLVGELRGDRVGVIAFAGTAFLQAPLTVDYSAVTGALKELDTEIIPQGGTNLEGALHAAVEAFGKGESDHRALIIFSDGEELDADAQKALEKLKDEVRVFAVGVGTPEGALIPLRGQYGGTEFVKDMDGNAVRSKLDETRLRAIAEVTGGFYLRLTTGRAEMDHIVRDGLEKMTEYDIDARLSRKPIERFEWPLSAALVLIAVSMLLGERRRIRPAMAAFAALALLPMQASAKNRGVEAYERQDYEGAKKAFTEQLERRPDSAALHFDLGAAAYKSGDHEAAMAEFSKALGARDPGLRSKAAYNLGNTLFQRGAVLQEKPAKLVEWKNAIQHYDEALKVNPKDENATYNREVVRKLIEKLEQEQKQQQQDKQDQDKKDEDKKEDQQKDKQQQKDQKDQKQDQQQQNSGKGEQDQQQKQQDGQQQKQDGAEKPQPSEGSQENKDDQKGDQKKDGQKGDEKKDDGAQKQQGQKGDQKNDDQKQGEQPQPQQPEKKKEGELKSQPQGGKAGQGEQGEPGDQEQRDAAEAAADAQAAAEGKMTPQQARALLESLKGEDDKVRLADPRERTGVKRVLRNW